ncbi:hypothetical protein CVV26_00315 [Candidatus Kuenenbacteria bacterium HGW-Kuenenbacteria-1]|uniref:Serine/threonine protein kinase n=1 Tax=Candidatus Kuenenbacteria bacterium HGW-Kuenenbacteria-1 TaxID=2013812 RepID=A0A2N1UP79_9BACT|nr:MAG: hypothetical protein CVV26_00315 [Candidatus Kuenenbacteria bacterium HGW-Kuenenbacteria-1]
MIFLNKQTLKNNLKKIVGAVIYNRGVNYFNSKYVKKIEVLSNNFSENIKIIGDIKGSFKNFYKSNIFFDLEKNEFSRFSCSCPCYEECKHCVALGLEFIDVYFEFLDQKELQNFNGNISFLRDNLTRWINKDEKQKKKLGLIEQKARTFFDKKNQEKQTKFKEFLKKFPLLSNKQIQIKEKIKSSKFEIENYHIILDFNENKRIYAKIKKDRQISYYDSNIKPSEILKHKKKLTQPQIELVEFLKEEYLWKDNIDYEKFFILLRDSKIKIYREQEKNKLFFGDISEKLKVELFIKKEKNKYFDWIKKDFIFKLNKFDFSTERVIFFIGKENLIIINIISGNISFYKLSKKLIEIISQISTKEMYDYVIKEYKYPFEFKLTENEIIDLNSIIKDIKIYFDLKTTKQLADKNFKIKKFNKAEPYILVDYKEEKNFLKIKATIDYEFCKVNVSDTVCSYYQNQKIFFKRKINENFIDYFIKDKYIIKIDEENIFYTKANKKKELEFFQKFYGNYGFNKKVECERKNEKDIFKYFSKYWEDIKKIGYKIEFIGDKFELVEENFNADFNVNLDEENGLLAFDVNCYCAKGKINLDDLKNYIKNKKEYIKIADGQMLKISNYEELERFIMMLESFYRKEKDHFEGGLYHAPELKNIFTSSKYYNTKVEESFNKFIQEAQTGKPVKKIKILEQYKKILRDYQKEGIDWFYFLRKYHFGGILADDMGLGKTLQTLILIQLEKIKNKPSIVICPKTLLYNWESEVKKFVPKIKTIIFDGLPIEREQKIKNFKKYDLIITSYATLQKDLEKYKEEKIKFNYCILDEAQFIKNHSTKNAQMVKKIDADYRLALTGTPLENNVSEIWSIFDFLMPGFLGSYKLFVEKFQNPIMKRNNLQTLDNLRKKISCFMLRRTKKEVLKELPSKIEQITHCHLESSQSILYQEILVNVKSQIFEIVKEKGFAKSQIHILAGLTKLRQVCNHPVLLLKDKDYTKYESAKLNIFLELINEIVLAKRKVLVFSQFTKMLDILVEELKKNKINYSYLSGKTKNRQEIVKDFNESNKKQVFLISLKAGGTGLNLTSADNVIIFDPWWNPSVEIQAIDRTHRIGQKNSVNVYRLITNGTIEEKIVDLQKRKQFLSDSLIGESQDLFKKLTWEDVKGLFE